MSSFVLIIGALALLGWITGSETLIRLHPGYAAMAPSTAISFLLMAGAVLWIHAVRGSSPARLAPPRLAAILVGLLAAVDLALIFSGVAGVDSLIWPEIDAGGVSRMAPATAICFLLSAGCAARLVQRNEGADLLFVAAATAGLLVAMIAVVGYIFDAQALYSVSVFTAMALHTALAFGALFMALLLMRADRGWLAILLGPGAGSAGSAGARRLFPVVLLVPLLLCLIMLAITKSGLWNENFRLSVLAITMMGLLAASVLRNAVMENTAERKQAALMRDLNSALGDRDLLLREVYHRVKNNLQQINALIRLESKNLEDEKSRAAFRSTEARIQALGTVHQLLISSSVPSQLNAYDFLTELCKNIAASNGARQRKIALRVDADKRLIHIDRAVPLGLLVNELVSNAFKHAFDEAGGVIVVSYLDRESGCWLRVSDNGRGMPEGDAGYLAGHNAGSRIIRGLAGQIGGELSVKVENGTIVSVAMSSSFEDADAHA